MGKWIDVKEKLPRLRQVVLAYAPKHGVHIEQHFGVTRGFYLAVTHWMELPEAPLQAQTPTDQTLKNPSAGRGR